MTLEVAEAVGGFTALTPSGTSVLLEGQLVKAPENAKQVHFPTPLDCSNLRFTKPMLSTSIACTRNN